MTSPSPLRAPSFLRTLASFAVLVIFTMLLASSALIADEARARSAITVITRVNGEVIVRQAGGFVTPARNGDVLTAGDTIRTESGAYVELTYFEGSSVWVGSSTELVIAALATDLHDGGTVALLDAPVRTWNVVTKLFTGSSRYDVRTPTSTASVRG